jgi:hypothetical protein
MTLMLLGSMGGHLLDSGSVSILLSDQRNQNFAYNLERLSVPVLFERVAS